MNCDLCPWAHLARFTDFSPTSYLEHPDVFVKSLFRCQPLPAQAISRWALAHNSNDCLSNLVLRYPLTPYFDSLLSSTLISALPYFYPLKNQQNTKKTYLPMRCPAVARLDWPSQAKSSRAWWASNSNVDEMNRWGGKWRRPPEAHRIQRWQNSKPRESDKKRKQGPILMGTMVEKGGTKKVNS